MKTPVKVLTSIAVILFVYSCSNQRYVSSETDDLYFTASDRKQAESNEYGKVSEVTGNSFSNSGNEPGDNGYFVKGKASKNNDQNPNAEAAYAANYQSANSGIQFDQQPTSTGENTTINNFYGNTTYYEEDYYDQSYASRIRRFDNVNIGLGYGYYDPFFVDPFWSYGWNRYPVNGWSIGWNSWSGWGVGYNWGWGVGPRWGAGWGGCWNVYDPWCRWGNPWGGNPWAWGGPWGNQWGWGGAWGNQWGWGGNPYWAGYQNGYWNGFNDGLWLGASTNQRGVSIARRGLATERGFGNGTRASDESPNRVIQNTRIANNTAAGRIENASKINQTKTNNNGGLVADGSRLYQAPERQVVRPVIKENNTESRANNINTNAVQASDRYKNPAATNGTVMTRDKYNAQGLTRTSREQLYEINRPTQSSATSSSRDRNVQRNTPAMNQNTQGRPAVAPNTNTTPRPTPNRNYSTPSDRANERPRYYSPSQNGSRNNSIQNRPNYTPDRGNQSPGYRPQQSPTNRVTPNRSNSRPSAPSGSRGSNISSPSRGNSTPSRNFSPSGGSSPSRNFSAPSGSSPSRSGSAPSRSSGGRR